ncbi:GNAT family N-acetyltransferase [Streptomyces sp. ISL-44]|uniref:GNAT family N-acetyltransferase n=1 Tax=unclassified Streptomyces TaxID=2593676 RepID=UPI001BE72275|nr:MULTISPECIES: GNAT family protein [unclassified Streptomyces]MBT2544397.1 GNAT family N-acetyltransferase [Streptomyces sp. ISL-44]MCX5013676.1 GNAT family N-acetyltransferase [Streptomyces sp. NBC_00555]MCX5607694.1 GNAT family N-acetyltransferase [Streptomyces sp. NBC_00047]UUU41778.1 GNAT family N-acetyltransferase [Streptomyces sp. NBC_00162]
MIIDGVEMRGLEPGDAAGLAGAYARNRAYMAPFEPDRPEDFYTEQGQRARIEGMLADRDAGRMVPYVLVEAVGGTPVGAINLGSIALGPLCSGGVGYWVDQDWNGKGLATAALEEVCRVARDEVGLHRVEAGTLLDNPASQRVLAKAGFEAYGVAPRYLHINGAWRDHRLFQRLLHDDPPGR